LRIIKITQTQGDTYASWRIEIRCCEASWPDQRRQKRPADHGRFRHQETDVEVLCGAVDPAGRGISQGRWHGGARCRWCSEVREERNPPERSPAEELRLQPWGDLQVLCS